MCPGPGPGPGPTWTRASSSLAKSPDVSPATSLSSSFLNTERETWKTVRKENQTPKHVSCWSLELHLTVFVNPLDLQQLLVAPGADDLDQRLLVCSQTLNTNTPKLKLLLLHRITALCYIRHQVIKTPPEHRHLHGSFELGGVVLSRALHQTQHQSLQRAGQRPLQGRIQILTKYTGTDSKHQPTTTTTSC